MPVFFISVDISVANILTEFGGTTPRGPPQTDPYESISSTAFVRDLVFI